MIAGECVIDPAIVAELLRPKQDALAASGLSPREMLRSWRCSREGLSNAGIV